MYIIMSDNLISYHFEAPDQSLVSPTPNNCLSILLVVVTIVSDQKFMKIRRKNEDEETSQVCPDTQIEDDQKGGGLL